MKGMKILFFVVDGLGDKRYGRLGGKTPLQYADTPNIDSLIRNGRIEMKEVIKGIAPESDEAMLAMLGYNVYRVHRGRGMLEAYGAGARFKKGDVVLRANFARLEDKGLETESRPSPDYVKMLKRIRKIDGVHVRFVRTVGHRAVLVLHGKDLSTGISNTNPTYKIVRNYVTTALPKNHALNPLKAKALAFSAEKTAGIVNKFAELSKYKNNIILLRGASNELPRLKGMKNWALISEMPVEIGIGKCAKMRIVKPVGGTAESAGQIAKLLGRHNVYVQVKGPDAYAHRGDVFGKVREIERIDKLIGKILGQLKKRRLAIRIVVTADHSTRCDTKAHSSLPVPWIEYELRP